MRKATVLFFVSMFFAACGPVVPDTDAGTPDDGGQRDDSSNPPPPDGGRDTSTPDDGGGRSCTYDELFEDDAYQGEVLTWRRAGSESCTSCTCSPGSAPSPDTCTRYPELCTGPAGTNTCSGDNGTSNCGYNLPPEIPYSSDDFFCFRRINYDTWVQGGLVTVRSGIYNGQIIAYFSFHGPRGVPPGDLNLYWTCGPMNRCWLNWANPESPYGRCWIRFWTDGAWDTPGCLDAANPPSLVTATFDCYPPGTTVEQAEAGIGQERTTAVWNSDG